jgi:hypothetical protein
MEINTLKISGDGYYVNGDTQVDLEFADEATKADIATWLVNNNAEEEFTADELAVYTDNLYKHRRAEEYPPMVDYLDGIVKGDTEQVDKYISDCQAVKDKYPKGE